MQSGLESSELAKKKVILVSKTFFAVCVLAGLNSVLSVSHSEVGSKRSLTPVCQQYQQRGLEVQTT